jgi:5-enolpyruvylshikimate-3-phosphate synthase
MADYLALKTELAKPDLSGLSDAAAAAKLNTDTVQTTVDRGVIDAYEVINATVPAEWASLTAAEKQRYQTFTGAGLIDVQNANTRAAFLAMFAAGTTTRANLAALQTKTTTKTRAESIAGWGQPVAVGDVSVARNS